MKQLICLICLPLQLICQNTIGFPDIINYAKQDYKAGLQNWDIKQDKNGIIYFANNEGLLNFDGKYWRNYPLPNKTIVRSIEMDSNNHIYVGGQDELGFFKAEDNGILKYHSLINQIAQKDRSFGDVWDIILFKEDVFFRSNSTIFRFNNRTVTAYKAHTEWSLLSECNGSLFAHDLKTGILKFENNSWTPLFTDNPLPINDPITSILPFQHDSTIITTLKNGLFLLSKSQITVLPSINNKIFKNERIYAASNVNNHWMALATSNNGIYITDLKGNIIQRLSKAEGLQNNNVLSIFLDNQQNLWLGLDNGIDLIAYNSSIKQIKPMAQDGSGYTAIVYNNYLFLGTSNGLFSVPLQSIKDMSFSKGNFTIVNNTKGQIWGLANINNQLLVGHHEGAFTVKANTAVPLSFNRGFWKFISISNTFPTAQIVSGGYNGLNLFDYTNGSFVFSKKIPGLNESSRFIAIDNNDNIWVSHPYHGLFKITKKLDGIYTTFTYTEKNGLPSIFNNHIYTIKNELVVATEKGIYVYNNQKDKFEVSEFYKNLLGNKSIRYLKEDNEGNVWFIHDKILGVLDFSKKNIEIIYLPELNNKMLSGFEFIYSVNKNNIFLGGEKGFYHINYEKYRQTLPKFNVQIRSLRIFNTTDSLLFGGYNRLDKPIPPPQ